MPGDRLWVSVHLVGVAKGSISGARPTSGLGRDRRRAGRDRPVDPGDARIPGTGRWADGGSESNPTRIWSIFRAQHLGPPVRCRPVVRRGALRGGHRAGSSCPAWAELAAARPQRVLTQGARPSEAMPAARPRSRAALDSSLAVAHTALAQVRFLYDRDWPAADSAFPGGPWRSIPAESRYLWCAPAARDRPSGRSADARPSRPGLDPLDPGRSPPPRVAQPLHWQVRGVRGLRPLAGGGFFPRGTRRLLGLLAEVMGDYELAESQPPRSTARPTIPRRWPRSAACTRSAGGPGPGVLARLDSLTAARYVSPISSPRSPRRSAIAVGLRLARGSGGGPCRRRGVDGTA